MAPNKALQPTPLRGAPSTKTLGLTPGCASGSPPNTAMKRTGFAPRLSPRR